MTAGTLVVGRGGIVKQEHKLQSEQLEREGSATQHEVVNGDGRGGKCAA